MSDTDPPSVGPCAFTRHYFEPLLKEVQQQTQLTREVVGVLRDLRDELRFQRSHSERVERLEHRIEHLLNAAAGGT